MDYTEIVMSLIDIVANYTNKNINNVTKDDLNIWINKFWNPALRNFYSDEIINIQKNIK